MDDVVAVMHFTVERLRNVLCVTPQCDLAGIDQDAIAADIAGLLASLAEREIRHVVVDFGKVPYFGSAMLETVLALWREARSRGGKLAVCSLSEAALQVVHTVKFDTLWPIFATREEALAAMPEANRA